jgi:hypothetical protein
MFTLHTEALAWLRYGKRMPIVCTEAGKWNADVLGMNSKMCIEVEVKHSISDLRADFRNKAHKHYLYQQANPKHATGYEKGWHTNIPNFFYFLTPAELKDKALEIIADKAPYAGSDRQEPASLEPVRCGQGQHEGGDPGEAPAQGASESWPCSLCGDAHGL